MTDPLPVTGFRWAGVHCGIKQNTALDLALIVSERPAAVAGVFTTNRVKAAPVLYDMQIVEAGQPVRAVVVNSGNANAVTGEQGIANTRRMAAHTAQVVGCTPDEVLVLSTGVIGVQLPMDNVLRGIEMAADVLRADAVADAAHAIMTTDTRPKIASARAAQATVTGIAKGAGMIAPDMATMLSVIATDAAAPADLGGLLRAAIAESFNRIVVDGDMSTNDTVLLLANGAAGAPPRARCAEAVDTVSRELARMIVRDGEGATKFVTLRVEGAPDAEAAHQIAHAIATSPLCKTAFHGSDPNWGRILAAAGRAGVAIDPAKINLWLAQGDQRVQLVADGQPTDYEEAAASAIMQHAAFTIRLDASMGEAGTTIWTCDLSPEYITINADYRT